MLSAHLWKEWREQRGMLLTLVGLLVVLAGIAYVVIDAHQLGADYRLDSLPTWMFHVGVLVGVVVLASELVPGESRCGQIGWMLRLPRAMRHAFVAKWILLLAGTLLLAFVGAGAGWVVGTFAEQPHSWPGVERRVADYELARTKLVLGTALAFAPWAFAVSCWMPRGTLVVPAALLLVAPIVLPLTLIGSTHFGLPKLVLETPLVIANVALAGSLCAWVSFRYALSRGLRALPLTAGVTVAALAPLMVAAAVRLHAWHYVDLGAPEARITGGFLGADGRRLFLVAGYEWKGPHYSVIADLTTGDWVQHGPAMATFSAAGVLDRSEVGWPSQPGMHRMVVRHQRTMDGRALAGPPTILDGRTGDHLGDGDLFSCPPETFELLRHERMLNTLLRDRDGRRIWFERDAWYREGHGDTAPECMEDIVGLPGIGCGIGLRLFVPGLVQQRLFDPLRARTFDLPTNKWVVILADTWLVRDHGTPAGTWTRYDPETGERGDPLPLADIHLLDERTVASIDAVTGELFGIAPATMERRRIEVDAGPGKLTAVLSATICRLGLMRTPSGAPIVRLRFNSEAEEPRVAFGRFSDQRIVTTDHAKDLTLLGFDGDDAVIAIVDERRIERLRFGGGRDVLFPR